MVKAKADSIAAVVGKDALIILAGDFNSTPEDAIIDSLTENYRSELSMINLSDGNKWSKGTYRYKGTWEMIDQVLVSEGLLLGNRGIKTDVNSFRIFSAGFLLKEDPNYPGESPFSTYSGYRYQGGFSDHLPVLLDLTFRNSF